VATAAHGLLREFEASFGGIGDAPPVPVERIAMSLLDLDIEEHDDLRSLPGAPQDKGRLSGMLDPENMTIWLDRREAKAYPRRRRFTIAHEAGHFRLHRTDVPVVIFEPVDQIAENYPDPDDAPSYARQEAEANAFARELLMPRDLVTEHARQTGCNIAALSERFDVSPPAIRLRLRLLGLLPAWMTS
jgi:hypothetical protein